MLLAGVICQDDEEAKSHEAKLCEDKSSGELFRLKSGKDSCRDVIQCTAAVSGSFRKSKSLNLSFSRACKPSDAPLASPSTWRSRRVIGSGL